jgi:hypothetical protein
MSCGDEKIVASNAEQIPGGWTQVDFGTLIPAFQANKSPRPGLS